MSELEGDGPYDASLAEDSLSGDTVVEDDGVLEPADSLETDDLTSDVLDTGVDAGDGYLGSNRYGTTWEEEERGEGLDDLLAEEEPEAAPDQSWTDEEQPDDVGGTQQPRAGRLRFLDEDEELGAVREADLVATDVGTDGGAASAEEAAVHLTDAPPFR